MINRHNSRCDHGATWLRRQGARTDAGDGLSGSAYLRLMGNAGLRVERRTLCGASIGTGYVIAAPVLGGE